VVPYLDLVHITASWVWGAGGHFVNRSGNRMLVNGAEARAGLKAYFQLYRYLPASAHHLDDSQCFELFAGGEAAVMIAGMDWALNMVKLKAAAPETLAHLGATTLPGISWIGGDNLVIWSHNVRSYSAKREQAAVSLANFLVSQATQVKYSQLKAGLPVRFDALTELTITPEALAKTIERALRSGRPHRAISLWTRVEHQLGQALSKVAEALLADPTAEIDNLLVQHVEPAARRLDQILRY
jgi:ABC-type glycerol-3-phosphate transport system substrate-binding protein